MELKTVRPQRQTDEKYFSHLFRVICYLFQMRRLFEGGAYSSKYGSYPALWQK